MGARILKQWLLDVFLVCWEATEREDMECREEAPLYAHELVALLRALPSLRVRAAAFVILTLLPWPQLPLSRVGYRRLFQYLRLLYLVVLPPSAILASRLALISILILKAPHRGICG